MHEPLPPSSPETPRSPQPIVVSGAPAGPAGPDGPTGSSEPADDESSTPPVLGRPERVVWSYSRDQMLQRCQRQYALTHVFAQDGWRKDATPHVAEAYRLKNLRSLSAEVGSAVHRRAQECERAVVSGAPLPSYESLYTTSKAELNALARSSRNLSGFLAKPNRVGMLREVYYDEELSLRSTLVDRARETLTTALAALVASPLWDELRAIERPQDNIVVPDPFYLFEVFGHRIYAAPDLVYRRGDQWTVVDWKTGRDGNDGEVDQIAVYGLAVVEGLGWPLTSGCEGRIINLVRGEESRISLTARDLIDVLSRMDARTAEMRSLVTGPDGKSRLVSPEDFGMTHRERDCSNCVFKAACYPAVGEAIARRDAPPKLSPPLEGGEAADSDAA